MWNRVLVAEVLLRQVCYFPCWLGLGLATRTRKTRDEESKLSLKKRVCPVLRKTAVMLLPLDRQISVNHGTESISYRAGKTSVEFF